MAIFRGVGGSGSSSDNSFLQEVTAQATTATNKANEASTSATTASTKADEALASANSAASSVASLQNNSISSAAFNTGDGVLTLTKLGGATVTADLDGRFLTSETDPVFTSHVAHGITATNISQWDTAYGWGDHSTQGYITDITTQSDPKYLSAIGDDTTTGTITAAGLSVSGNVVSSGTCQANLLVSTGNANIAGALTVIGNYNSLNGSLNLSNGNITLGGTVDGRNVSTDGAKLDNIEANATADQTDAEIKTAYENNADTNAFTDAEKSKLSGIEASADVTDTANVTAAGALMDSEVTNLAQVKAFDSSDYATAAQGSTANSALQNLVDDTTPQLGGGLDLNGNDITGTGNISADTFTGGDTVLTQTGTLSSDAVLTLKSTDSGHITAPHLLFDRVSGSPADNDGLGSIVFQGRDSINQATPYISITGKADDVTNATEDGQLFISARKGGVNTTLVDITSTKMTLDNGLDLDVDGTISAPQISVGASGISSVGGIYATASNIYGNTLQSAGNTTVGGNVVVTGTVDGRDVATDGARLDTIPYHRVKHTQLRKDAQGYNLGTSYTNIGLYDTIVHPATPVECARYLDLDIAILWNYVSSNTNDLFLQLQMVVPTGGGTVTNMGTATRENVNNPEYNGYSNYAWYYVSGDYTHLFTEFGRINTGTGTSEGVLAAWKYDSANDRTYLMTYDNPGVSFSTGDTFYYSPYAFESAGTTLAVTKEIDERYVSSGRQPHSFKFKTAYDDAALTYKLQMKEYTTSDSAQVHGTTVTFTDVEEL